MFINDNGSVFIYNTSNSLGVGTGGSLTVLGGVSIAKDMFVGGAVNSYSDIRLKTNIVCLPSVLDKLEDINPIYFNYSDLSGLHTKANMGFIAQDFINTFPELLTSYDSFYSLDYSKFCVVLLKAIKELKSEIKDLQNK
jgi:hypothetical protein